MQEYNWTDTNAQLYYSTLRPTLRTHQQNKYESPQLEDLLKYVFNTQLHRRSGCLGQRQDFRRTHITPLGYTRNSKQITRISIPMCVFHSASSNETHFLPAVLNNVKES